MDNKIFKLPFRLGKKQERAILDADGKEVVVFPRGRELMALEYVEFLNSKMNDND